MSRLMPPDLRKQIGMSYIITGLHFAWLWVPIWVLYYRRFTSFAGIGLLESLTMIISSGAILPWGILADRIGKKNTLVAATVLTCIGAITMGCAGTIWVLSISIVIMTLGGAAYLSSIEAFQYDTLKSKGFADAYPNVLAITTTLRFISSALSSAIGGFLYTVHPSFPFIGAGLLNAAAFFLAIQLLEPRIDSDQIVFDSVRKQISAGFKSISRPGIGMTVLVMIFIGILLTADSSGFWDIQAVSYGFSSQQLGVLYTVVYLALAVVSLGFGRISRLFSYRKVLVGTAIFFGGCMLISPVVGAFLGGILLTLRSMSSVIFDLRASVIFNAAIPSRVRATTLSAISAVRGAPYILFSYFLGRTIDVTGTKPVAFVQGIAMLMVGVLLIPAIRTFKPHVAEEAE